MIRDFDNYDNSTVIHTDLCIIGSGAAGLTVARQFFNTQWNIIVLEGGGAKEEEFSQEIYRSEIVGLPHDGIHEGRFRRFGGSTTAWGGQLLPLCEADFQEKSWVPQSGWPITYQDLESYYRRAETMMGVDGPPYDAQRWARFGIIPPELDDASFHYRFSEWATWGRRNLALSFGRELKESKNVTVLLHANALDIATNKASDAVEHVEIRSFTGKSGTVKARYYLVCCGGIETPRLLLASNKVAPEGVGNQRGLVGRYFQDHISLRAGSVIPRDRRTLQHAFDPFFRRGVMYTPKIEMRQKKQEQLGILNVMAQLKFEIPEESSLQDIKRILQAVQSGKNPLPSRAATQRIVRDSGDFARLAFGKIVLNRRLSMRQGEVCLIVDSEQAPNPQSRVTLSKEVDRFGMPRAALDWRLTELDIRTLCEFAGLLQTDWEARGLGEIVLKDPPPRDGRFWQENMRDIYHHMGTTRMSHDSQQGVVDQDCKVHGMANLFIGSSAVFPTSGNSNPTLTIMALCIRLADHLKNLSTSS